MNENSPTKPKTLLLNLSLSLLLCLSLHFWTQRVKPYLSLSPHHIRNPNRLHNGAPLSLSHSISLSLSLSLLSLSVCIPTEHAPNYSLIACWINWRCRWRKVGVSNGVGRTTTASLRRPWKNRFWGRERRVISMMVWRVRTTFWRKCLEKMVLRSGSSLILYRLRLSTIVAKV